MFVYPFHLLTWPPGFWLRICQSVLLLRFPAGRSPSSSAASQADVFFSSVASETLARAKQPGLEGGRQSAETIRNQTGLRSTQYAIFDFVCFFQHRVEVNAMEIPKRFLSSGAYSQGQGAFLTPATRAGEVSVLIMLCS